MEYINVLIGASLINNYVLGKMIGIAPFIGSPKNISSSFFMGLSISFVLFISYLLTYPIYTFIILPLKIEYLDLLIYTLFLMILIKLVFRFIETSFRFLYNTIGVYFPVIMFNSVFFGISFELGRNKYVFDFLSSLLYSLGCGLGYTLALILMSMLRERIPDSKLPEYLKGAPITLICAGIISMIFQIFKGIVELI